MLVGGAGVHFAAESLRLGIQVPLNGGEPEVEHDGRYSPTEWRCATPVDHLRRFRTVGESDIADEFRGRQGW